MTTDELDSLGPPRFVFNVAGSNARFEGRHVSVTPPERTIGFLYGDHSGKLRQIGAGVFKGGKWERLSKSKAPEPSHWVVMVND